MKKLFILLLLVVSLPAFAKKPKTFELAGREKYKPQNQKVFSKLWNRSLKSGNSAKRYYPETSSPTLDHGLIYVGTHGGLFYALDELGKILWKFKNGEPIASTAAVFGDKIVYTDLDGRITCLNKSGSLVWRTDLDQEMLGQPLITAGRIYLLKGESTIVALALESGSVVWQKKINTFIKDITMRGHAGMVVDGSGVYVGLADGHLYKMAVADGHIIWDKNLAVPLKTFKDIDASVVVHGDSLYVGGYAGAFYRLDKNSGQTLWVSDVATAVPPVLAGDVVVVSDTSGNLVGIDNKSGEQLWYNELEGQTLSAPALVGDRIFVTSYKSKAYVFESDHGHQLQQFSVGAGSINVPLVHGDRLYVLTNGASLVALRKN